MKNSLSLAIVKAFADELDLEYNLNELREKIITPGPANDFTVQDLNHIINELSAFIGLTFVEQNLTHQAFEDMFISPSLPLLVYVREESGLKPFMIKAYSQERAIGLVFEPDENRSLTLTFYQLSEKIFTKKDFNQEAETVHFLTPLVVSPSETPYQNAVPFSPMERFWRLIVTESRDIYYIYIYAVVAGILSLTTPLGVQAIIGLVSGGLILEPVVVLIGFVIVATLVSGFLQVMQVRIVETLQQRIVTRAAFEFSYRIPRISLEALSKKYAPELMNRFFDILTVQKGLAKVLTDMLAAVLQIFFGLILLTFYHPFFIFFGFFLILVLYFIFRLTGPNGLKTSIQESTYKYKMVHWLQEIARTLSTFQLAGFTNLSVYKMDEHVTHYLKKREAHFRVLIIQYYSIVLFKTIITGGILILGSFLVINNQITLGQFVASDIVIITILAAVEKIILNLDVVYDILTALEKIGQVTDIPLVQSGGVILASGSDAGYEIQAANLRYRYPDAPRYALNGIDFHIRPGEKIAILGRTSSGKTTFVNILAGLYPSYEGIVIYDGYSLRDVNINSLRDNIGDNLSGADIFDGTILENISVGKSTVTIIEAKWALEMVGLYEYVLNLPNGVHTHLVAGGKQLSSGVAKKIILARTLAEKPKMVIFDDFLYSLEAAFQEKIIDYMFDKTNTVTVVAVSQNPYLLRKSDRIFIMDEGKILKIGTYNELYNTAEFKRLAYFPSFATPETPLNS